MKVNDTQQKPENNFEGQKPIQPYIVLATSDYNKILENRFGISHFYEFTRIKEKEEMLAVPDGSVDLVFGLSDRGIRTFIGGTVLTAKTWEMPDSEQYFGIRFYAGEAALPDGLEMKDLVNTDVEITDDGSIRQLNDRLSGAGNTDERIQIFLDQYVNNFLRKEEKTTAEMLESYIRSRIYATGGRISIRALAEDSGYSECYIRRIFQKANGVSPKVFERFVRFQNVLDTLTHGGKYAGMSMDELAAENGYFDQSHLINEFKKFTGKTPEEYRRMITGTRITEL